MPEETPRLDRLLVRVVDYCAQERGRKAELARFLGVRPSQINEWLTNRRCKPSTEYALGLLDWLSTQRKTRKEREVSVK